MLLNRSACKEIQEFYPDDITQSSWFKTTFATVCTAIFLVSTSANICVVTMLMFRRSLRTVRNFYVGNLALTDFFVTVTCMPITAFTLVYKKWIFGAALCKLIPLFQTVSVLVSAFSLALVAIDRYLVLVHNIRTTKRQALWALLGSWLLSIGVALPIGIFQFLDGEHVVQIDVLADPEAILCGQFCLEAWPNHFFHKFYGFILLIIQYMIPLMIISACYALAAAELSRNAKAIRDNTPQYLRRASVDLRACRSAKRTQTILTCIVVSFCMCWLPQVALNVGRDLDFLPNIIAGQEYFVSALTHTCAMVFCVINPLVYIGTNRRFLFWRYMRSRSRGGGCRKSLIVRVRPSASV